MSPRVVVAPGPTHDWWRSEKGPDRGESDHGRSEASAASSIAFFALMVFSFILLLAPQSIFPALRPFRIAFVTGAFAAGFYVLDAFQSGQKIVFLTREFRGVAALLAWSVFTLPFSLWPGGSVAFLLDFYLKTIVVFWLLVGTVRTVERLQRVVWFLVLLTGPIAISGIRQYAAGEFIAELRIVGYQAPLTANPNDLALLLNLILPLTVSLLLVDRRILARSLLGTLLVLEVAAIIATFSRGGFLVLATIGATYLYKSATRRPLRVIWLPPILLVLAIPMLPRGYLQRLQTIESVESDETGSAQARWRDMFAALDSVTQHPIVGTGVGMDVLALNEQRGDAWGVLHNAFLQYAVDLGIPGLVLFVWLVVRCIGRAQETQRLCSQRGDPSSRMFAFAEALEVSLIAFVVGGFFHPIAYHVYFYYVAALALAAREIVVSLSAEVEPPLTTAAAVG